MKSLGVRTVSILADKSRPCASKQADTFNWEMSSAPANKLLTSQIDAALISVRIKKEEEKKTYLFEPKTDLKYGNTNFSGWLRLPSQPLSLHLPSAEDKNVHTRVELADVYVCRWRSTRGTSTPPSGFGSLGTLGLHPDAVNKPARPQPLEDLPFCAYSEALVKRGARRFSVI